MNTFLAAAVPVAPETPAITAQAYTCIEVFVPLFLLSAFLISVTRFKSWRLTAAIYWLCFWIPVAAAILYLFYFKGLSQKDGITEKYVQFWSKQLIQNTFLGIFFAAVLRSLHEFATTILLSKKENSRFANWLFLRLPDPWLAWLLLVTYVSWLSSRHIPDPYSRLAEWNANNKAWPLNLAFFLCGTVWLYSALHYELVKKESFSPAVLGRAVFSVLRIPIQILLIGPKLSGKSRIFSNLTGRPHIPSNDSMQAAGYNPEIAIPSPKATFLERILKRFTVSLIDPPGEQLGLHLHSLTKLRTDNLVFCLSRYQFNIPKLSTYTFNGAAPSLCADCLLAPSDALKYLNAFAMCIDGKPGKFRIRKITVFVDCYHRTKLLPDAFADTDPSVQHFREFAKGIAGMLRVPISDTYMFIGDCNNPSKQYCDLAPGTAIPAGTSVYLRDFLPWAASC